MDPDNTRGMTANDSMRYPVQGREGAAEQSDGESSESSNEYFRMNISDEFLSDQGSDNDAPPILIPLDGEKKRKRKRKSGATGSEKKERTPTVRFTKEQDEFIRGYVTAVKRNSQANINWRECTAQFNQKFNCSRTYNSVRIRFKNHLDKRIKPRPITVEEENLLKRFVPQYNYKWSMLTNLFEGRTQDWVRNQWLRLCRNDVSLNYPDTMKEWRRNKRLLGEPKSLPPVKRKKNPRPVIVPPPPSAYYTTGSGDLPPPPPSFAYYPNGSGNLSPSSSPFPNYTTRVGGLSSGGLHQARSLGGMPASVDSTRPVDNNSFDSRENPSLFHFPASQTHFSQRCSYEESSGMLNSQRETYQTIEPPSGMFRMANHSAMRGTSISVLPPASISAGAPDFSQRVEKDASDASLSPANKSFISFPERMGGPSDASMTNSVTTSNATSDTVNADIDMD